MANNYDIAGYRRFPLDMFILPTARGGQSVTFAVIDDFLRLTMNIDSDTAYALADKISNAVNMYKSTILQSLQSEEYGNADNIEAGAWGIILPVSRQQVDNDAPEARGLGTRDMFLRAFQNLQTVEYKNLLEILLRRFSYIGNAYKSFNEAAQSYDATPSTAETITTGTNTVSREDKDLYAPRGATPNALANGLRTSNENGENDAKTTTTGTAINAETRAAAFEVFAGDIVSRFVEYFESILDYDGGC